eukprot:188506-Alexandrium_andersonii.AAC.1
MGSPTSADSAPRTGAPRPVVFRNRTFLRIWNVGLAGCLYPQLSDWSGRQHFNVEESVVLAGSAGRGVLVQAPESLETEALE